jgi:hypothetical protein
MYIRVFVKYPMIGWEPRIDDGDFVLWFVMHILIDFLEVRKFDELAERV